MPAQQTKPQVSFRWDDEQTVHPVERAYMANAFRYFRKDARQPEHKRRFLFTRLKCGHYAVVNNYQGSSVGLYMTGH